MIEELLDHMSSLTAIMEEESDRLVAPGRVQDLSAMAAAKTRLVGSLEAKLAQLARGRPTWMEELEEANRHVAVLLVYDVCADGQVRRAADEVSVGELRVREPLRVQLCPALVSDNVGAFAPVEAAAVQG